MDIVIKGNDKQYQLELIDRNGTDCTVDIIGNHGGLGDDAHQFSYDADKYVYVCTQDTYDWWAKVLGDQQKLEDRIAELIEEHGSDAVYDAIGDAGDCDLEDQASAINAALDEAFGS